MQRLTHKTLLALALLTLLSLGRVFAQQSLNFDGNDDDVRLNLTTTSLAVTPAAFTLELWFRSTDVLPSVGPCPDGMRTLTRLTGQVYNLEVAECNNQLYVSSYFGVGGLTPPVAIGTTVARQWHHLSVQYSSGTTEIFLDCQLATTITGTVPVGIAELHLAEYNGVTGVNQPRHWLGEIDEVKLWSTATPVFSCADRFCSVAGDEPDLLAYWDFEQYVAGGNNAPLTTIPDQTANGNDGAAAAFTGNGVTSNIVRLNAPLVGPSLHGLNLTIRDYPYQTAPLTTICSGDPAHFTLDLNGGVPGPFSNVSVVWDYSDDAGLTWLPLNSPPFTDFQFPVLPGVLTANCGPSPTGFVDRSFRATATVTQAGTGNRCTYVSNSRDLRICCPVSPFTVGIAPPDPLCEGETVALNVSINSPDAWVNTPGPNTTISWQVTDENGTRPLAGQAQSTSFPYSYTAPALSAPLDVCFTATVTNCNGKSGTAQSCIRVDPEPECGLIDALPLGSPQNLNLRTGSPHPTYEICPGDDAVIGIDPANPFDKCVPQWQYSFTNTAGSWVTLGFSNSVQNTNILPSHLWPSGADRIFYRIECAPLSDPSGCEPCYSNLIEIILQRTPVAATINGPTRECLEDIIVAPVLLTVNNPVTGLTYDWFHNGRPLGSGLSQLVTEAGCYWLETTNGCQTSVGNRHCLEVCETVAVMSCPLAPNDCARLGDPVTLTACDSSNSCEPASQLGFKWYVDGVFQGTGCRFTYLPDPAGNTVRVEVYDPITGCAGSAERRVVPCDF